MKYHIFQTIRYCMILTLVLAMTAIPCLAEEYEDTVGLTQSGNMTLTDDITVGELQLITVTARDGHSFYIIIDRSTDGEENAVHFLNQVDETDLFAILNEAEPDTDMGECICEDVCRTGNINTECYVCLYTMTECTAKATEEADAEAFDTMGLVIMLLPMLIGGGVYAVLYLKKKQPKNRIPPYDPYEDDRE